MVASSRTKSPRGWLRHLLLVVGVISAFGSFACLLLLHDGSPLPAAEARRDSVPVSKGEPEEAAARSEYVHESDESDASEQAPRVPVAISSSQPEMTLHGHLVHRVNNLHWGDGKVLNRTHGPAHSVSNVIASRDFNPGRKTPTGREAEQLTALVESMRKRYAELATAEEGLRKEAVLRSLAKNNVVSIENGRPPSVFGDTNAVTKHTRDSVAAAQRLTADLEGRLGMRGKDWSYTLMTSTEPDGIARQNLIYFMRAQEPGLFKAREALSRFSEERAAAFREFFARL